LPGGIGLHYDNSLDARGNVRYTAFATGLALAGPERRGVPTTSVQNFGRYVVRGMVRDEKDEPVWGIPIQVDEQVIYSNEQGQFFVHLKKRGEYHISVAVRQALNPGSWEVVSAPASVLANSEEAISI